MIDIVKCMHGYQATITDFHCSAIIDFALDNDALTDLGQSANASRDIAVSSDATREFNLQFTLLGALFFMVCFLSL